jgi:hypothetical protein
VQIWIEGECELRESLDGGVCQLSKGTEIRAASSIAPSWVRNLGLYTLA